MPLYVTWLSKWLCTNRAAERFLTSMNSQMILQVKWIGKWLCTLWATVWFLSGMHFHMALKMPWTREWPSALFTWTGFIFWSISFGSEIKIQIEFILFCYISLTSTRSLAFFNLFLKLPRNSICLKRCIWFSYLFCVFILHIGLRGMHSL